MSKLRDRMAQRKQQAEALQRETNTNNQDLDLAVNDSSTKPNDTDDSLVDDQSPLAAAAPLVNGRRNNKAEDTRARVAARSSKPHSEGGPRRQSRIRGLRESQAAEDPSLEPVADGRRRTKSRSAVRYGDEAYPPQVNHWSSRKLRGEAVMSLTSAEKPMKDTRPESREGRWNRNDAIVTRKRMERSTEDGRRQLVSSDGQMIKKTRRGRSPASDYEEDLPAPPEVDYRSSNEHFMDGRRDSARRRPRHGHLSEHQPPASEGRDGGEGSGGCRFLRGRTARGSPPRKLAVSSSSQGRSSIPQRGKDAPNREYMESPDDIASGERENNRQSSVMKRPRDDNSTRRNAEGDTKSENKAMTRGSPPKDTSRVDREDELKGAREDDEDDEEGVATPDDDETRLRQSASPGPRRRVFTDRGEPPAAPRVRSRFSSPAEAIGAGSRQERQAEESHNAHRQIRLMPSDDSEGAVRRRSRRLSPSHPMSEERSRTPLKKRHSRSQDSPGVRAEDRPRRRRQNAGYQQWWNEVDDSERPSSPPEMGNGRIVSRGRRGDRQSRRTHEDGYWEEQGATTRITRPSPDSRTAPRDVPPGPCDLRRRRHRDGEGSVGHWRSDRGPWEDRQPPPAADFQGQETDEHHGPWEDDSSYHWNVGKRRRRVPENDGGPPPHCRRMSPSHEDAPNDKVHRLQSEDTGQPQKSRSPAPSEPRPGRQSPRSKEEREKTGRDADSPLHPSEFRTQSPPAASGMAETEMPARHGERSRQGLCGPGPPNAPLLPREIALDSQDSSTAWQAGGHPPADGILGPGPRRQYFAHPPPREPRDGAFMRPVLMSPRGLPMPSTPGEGSEQSPEVASASSLSILSPSLAGVPPAPPIPTPRPLLKPPKTEFALKALIIENLLMFPVQLPITTAEVTKSFLSLFGNNKSAWTIKARKLLTPQSVGRAIKALSIPPETVLELSGNDLVGVHEQEAMAFLRNYGQEHAQHQMGVIPPPIASPQREQKALRPVIPAGRPLRFGQPPPPGAAVPGMMPPPSLATDKTEALELLLSAPTAKDRAKHEGQSEIRLLLAGPTMREKLQNQVFRNKGGSSVREFCAVGTREDCTWNRGLRGLPGPCSKVHFRRVIFPHTDPQLGDCSYLDTCRHIESCRFVHYEIDLPDLHDDKSKSAKPKLGAPIFVEGTQKSFDACTVDANASHEIGSVGIEAESLPAQWINCDIRTIDMSIFQSLVKVVMADPPWDIHMDLPYGTMTDSEMREMKVGDIHEEGVLFLWVTGRALELGRECMKIWGYRWIDEIVWVKTNQLQRVVRTGRTGHWLNHSKEHCLVGVKGSPKINRMIDGDVIVAEVRETSRKPDEIYRMIERMCPGTYKLELFGRQHNCRNNWITLGNQLNGVRLHHPQLIDRYNSIAPGLGLPESKLEEFQEPSDGQSEDSTMPPG